MHDLNTYGVPVDMVIGESLNSHSLVDSSVARMDTCHEIIELQTYMRHLFDKES